MKQGEKYFANEELVARINRDLGKVDEAYKQIIKHNYGIAKDLLKDVLSSKYVVGIIRESDVEESYEEDY